MVQALKEIFAEGQEFTDVQVMMKLQEKLDISEFLYQMKKLDYSMTDLIGLPSKGGPARREKASGEASERGKVPPSVSLGGRYN